jgi:hypothetical protein
MKVKDLVDAGNDVGFRIAGNPPHRGSDLVDLLPGIRNLGFGRPYQEILENRLDQYYDLTFLDTGTYQVTTNPYLEAGVPLHQIFPSQKTHYHFDLALVDSRTADSLIASTEDQYRIGVYCSSNSHRPDLGMWSVDEWIIFLEMIKEILPNVTFVMLGAAYDDKTFEVYRQLLLRKHRVVSALGFCLNDTVQVIKQLHYFFAFPSGLGILSDVVNTPCMMWYWSNLIKANEKFLNTYCDPESVRRKIHLNVPYIKPHHSASVFESFGKFHARLRKK